MSETKVLVSGVVPAASRSARIVLPSFATSGAGVTLTRLPQLGGYEDANPLIFRDRTPKGRHYRAADGKLVRTRSDGDPRRGLLRQGHAELVQQKLELLVRPGMARQDEVPAVGGR